MPSLESLLVCILIAAQYSYLVASVPFEKYGRSICSRGIYGELAPILAQHASAEAYCSAVYPISCTAAGKEKRTASETASSTTIATTNSSTLATRNSSTIATRNSSTTASKDFIHYGTTNFTYHCRDNHCFKSSWKISTPILTSKSSTTISANSSSSAWSRFQQQPPHVISTICSCIGILKVSTQSLRRILN